MTNPVAEIDLATTENPDEDGRVACFDCGATFHKQLAFRNDGCPECFQEGLGRLFEQRDEAEKLEANQIIGEAEAEDDSREVEA